MTSSFANPVQTAMAAPSTGTTWHFQHPLDLTSLGEEPMSLIDVYESVSVASSIGMSGGTGRFLGTIALPVPPQLSNTYSFQYEEKSMPIDQMVSFVRELEGAGKLTDAMERAVVSGVIAAKLGDSLNMPDWLEKKFGYIVNPHMAMLFKGVKFRSFDLSWALIARSAAESEQIKNIIYRLKYHSHPDNMEGSSRRRYFLYPENFRIQVISGGDFLGGNAGNQPPGYVGNALFKTGLCVLTDMTVTYNGSSIPTFFRGTGEPVDIRLRCHFVELQVLTKNELGRPPGYQAPGN